MTWWLKSRPFSESVVRPFSKVEAIRQQWKQVWVETEEREKKQVLLFVSQDFLQQQEKKNPTFLRPSREKAISRCLVCVAKFLQTALLFEKHNCANFISLGDFRQKRFYGLVLMLTVLPPCMWSWSARETRFHQTRPVWQVWNRAF